MGLPSSNILHSGSFSVATSSCHLPSVTIWVRTLWSCSTQFCHPAGGHVTEIVVTWLEIWSRDQTSRRRETLAAGLAAPRDRTKVIPPVGTDDIEAWQLFWPRLSQYLVPYPSIFHTASVSIFVALFPDTPLMMVPPSPRWKNGTLQLLAAGGTAVLPPTTLLAEIIRSLELHLRSLAGFVPECILVTVLVLVSNLPSFALQAVNWISVARAPGCMILAEIKKMSH